MKEKQQIIKEIKKQLTILNNAVETLLTSAEETNNTEIDITRLEQLAKNSAFRHHFIRSYDPDIILRYCTLLAAAVRLTDNVEKKTRQYYFIARILVGSRAEAALGDVLTSAEMLQFSDLEQLSQDLGADIKMLLLDAFLLMALDGKIEEKQLDYVCEMMAYLNYNKNEIEAIFHVGKCILTGQEKESLLPYREKFPIRQASCYMKTQFKGDIVSSIDSIQASKADVLVVVEMGFENIELELDSWKKREIFFENCSFKKNPWIHAQRTQVHFSGCQFEDPQKPLDVNDIASGKIYGPSLVSGTQKFRFELSKAEFENCNFENCGYKGTQTETALLYVGSGLMKNCRFQNCEVEAAKLQNEDEENSYGRLLLSLGAAASGKKRQKEYDYAALVYASDLNVQQCEFESCKIWGSESRGECAWGGAPDRQSLNILYGKKIQARQCAFKNCECKGRERDSTKKSNYLINAINVTENGNTYEHCSQRKKVGSAEWEL